MSATSRIGKNATSVAGTTGWSATYNGRPTAIWQPRVLTANGLFGVMEDGFGFGFGFSIGWANDLVVNVKACTDLSAPSP